MTKDVLASHSEVAPMLPLLAPWSTEAPVCQNDDILLSDVIRFLRGNKVKVKVKSLSRVRLFVTPWTVAHQAPPSMEFSRQEYWSGLPFPSPGDLPDPGIEPRSPALQADTLASEPPGKHLTRWGNIQFLSEKSACEWVPEEIPKRPWYLQRRLLAAHSVLSLRGSSHALFANHTRPNVSSTLHVLVGFALFSASQIGAAGLDKNTVTKSCPSLCEPMGCSTPGFPALHYHPELAQTHIHWVGDAIQLSHPLLPPSPPALNLSQYQGLDS